MSILVCLLKGCGISHTKDGHVICPDCRMNYCWDRDFGPWTLRMHEANRKYPFGNWVPCHHDKTCKNRKLHKNRGDSLAAFVLENEKVGTRCERYKPTPEVDLQRKGT